MTGARELTVTRVIAARADEAMRQHDGMDFAEGWGACADQLKAQCEDDGR